MDRRELSEAIGHDLSALFAAEVRAAGPALLAADLDGMKQRVQQPRVLDRLERLSL